MAKYCKHCNQKVKKHETYHDCPKKGLLSTITDPDFLISAAIGAATDSALLGGFLGGSMLGGIVGDLLDGDLFD